MAKHEHIAYWVAGEDFPRCSDCHKPLQEKIKTINVKKAKEDLIYFAEKVLGIRLFGEQKAIIKEIMKGKKLKIRIFNGWRSI